MLESTDSDAGSVAFSGEVWTDARGYATVVLPLAVGRLHAGLDYELRAITPGVTAHIAAELSDGRFTIATDEPHVGSFYAGRAVKCGGRAMRVRCDQVVERRFQGALGRKHGLLDVRRKRPSLVARR
jgi:hypothetical protein